LSEKSGNRSFQGLDKRCGKQQRMRKQNV